MLIVLSFAWGLLVPFLPIKIIWPTFILNLCKPKTTIIPIIFGICLSLANQEKPLKTGIYSERVTQVTKIKHKSAKLKIIRNGKIVLAKIPKSFYLKSAKCKLQCSPTKNSKNGWQLESKWYYMSQHIIGQCQALACKAIKTTNFWAKLKLKLENLIPNKLKNTEVLRALLFGQSYLIDPDSKSLFKFAGLAHLIAVSGLHIGLIANMLGRFFGLIWRIFLPYLWRIPKVFFIDFGCYCGAIFYSCLSGFGEASCRALAMIIISRLSQNFVRLNNEQVLILALGCILLFSPSSIFSLGLWLSAIAVWALINAKSILQGQLNIIIVMLPIQSLMAWPIGWWMPLTNLIAIPLFSIFLVPGAFIASIISLFDDKYAYYLWQACDVSLTYFFKTLVWLKQQLGWGLTIPTNGYWQIIYLGLFAFYFVRKFYISCIISIIMWLIINCKAIEYGTFSVEVFDVGQGLSVLIRTNRHNMLVDAGSRYMGQHVVLNVLRQYGINLLDTIIISHGDSDHSAGLVEILKGVKYRTLIAGEPSRMYIKSLECSNTSWEWDGVVFSTYQIRSMQKHNNLSCIVHVQAKGKSILMPGDIEANAENYLLKNTVPGSLHADILLAPHHGSISSGTHAFIKAVAPKIIVVSAGKYKLYKHPAKAHIRFWDQQHIKHLNTHLVGSIKL